MNRGKSSKSNRSTNKNGKTTVQNGGGGGGGGTPSANSKGAITTSTTAGDGNDVSGAGWSSTKKAIKANKKSSKAAKQVNISTVNSTTSSVKSSNNTASPMISHHLHGNGMNSSAMNNNKAKSAAPVNELPKKLERSHSFISRGFSKLYSSITGSRDGINKIPEDKEVNSTANSSSSSSPEPPRFRRSLTLGSFSIKRRSMRESALEKLSEENELKSREDSNTTSPRDSQSIPQTPSVTDVPGTVEFREPIVNDEEEPPSPEYRRRRTSFGQASLADIDKNASRYGSGLMSRLKRTFSITSEKRKQMNPSWSASLQNLQSIDTMVSYNDLSFIDYDKFNEMDKRYEALTASQMQLNRISSGSYVTPPPMSSTPVYPRDVTDGTKIQSVDKGDRHLDYSLSTKSEQSTRLVKRREPKLNTDHTKNLDEGKNLYRQSLDSQKLQFLNERNRESFRFSSSFDPKTVDYLLLDNCASLSQNDRDSGLLSGSRTWKSKDEVTGYQRRFNSAPCLNWEKLDTPLPLVSCILLLIM